MPIRVDWEKSLQNWSPSQGARPISQEGQINKIIELMNYVVEDFVGKRSEDILLLNPEETKNRLIEHMYAKDSLIEDAALQLMEHKKVWETHLDGAESFAFELPIYLVEQRFFYYLKLIIKRADVLNDFGKLKSVAMSFHPSRNCLAEVFFV